MQTSAATIETPTPRIACRRIDSACTSSRPSSPPSTESLQQLGRIAFAGDRLSKERICWYASVRLDAAAMRENASFPSVRATLRRRGCAQAKIATLA